MAVNLKKVKQDINKLSRQEDRALASLQKYFANNKRGGTTRQIKLTTSLVVGGKEVDIDSTESLVDAAGNVLKQTSKPINREMVHNHRISWDDIERSYFIQQALHSRLASEYYKAHKVYKGRSLYQTREIRDAIDAAGRNIKVGQGSRVNNPWTPYGRAGRYGKIDVDIHRKVLHEIYDELYKETNKHLLDKFSSIDISGSGDLFNKMIKGTQELIFDINKVKNWSKEVKDIIEQAYVKYNAQVREEQRKQARAIQKAPLLTIQQLELIGRAILGLAIENCPIETGFLRSSGKLYVSSNSIRIIFECPYAAYVHDNPNAQHPIGKYHFLVDAAQEILPTISVWTETTGDDAFVLGDYYKQTWDRGSNGAIISDMHWTEVKGYQAVYIDIDTNLRVNYAHYK